VIRMSQLSYRIRSIERDTVVRRVVAALPVAVLIVLVLVVTAKQPTFLGIRSIRTLLDGAAPILLLALGQTLVILTGGIDLSVAALASLGTVLLAKWLPGMGPGAILAMLLALTVAGLVNGLACAYLQVPSFIVTLGAMGLWSGVGLTISGASTISISDGYDAIGWIREQRVAQLPASFVLAAVITVLAAVVMRAFTRGRLLHALGLSERAVLMSGVRTPTDTCGRPSASAARYPPNSAFSRTITSGRHVWACAMMSRAVRRASGPG
jgi:ribose transport system permease protein